MTFNVVDVSSWQIADAVESIGTRPKVWLRDDDGSLWLFKEARSDADRPSGQDWAEKAVAELARLIGIPVANVELAHRNGTRGIVSQNFVARGATLVHGNELLSARDPSYPQDQLVNDTEGYTVDAIRDVLKAYEGPTSGRLLGASAFDYFFGYLVLDAWVNNTDRHHRNWGVVMADRRVLAPSFDHGSSLAFGETDESRLRLLQGGLERWLDGGRTRSFEGMPSMIDVVATGLEWLSSEMQAEWFDRLAGLTHDEVDGVLNRLPVEGPVGVIFSDTSRTLCKEILWINQARLLNVATTH